MNPEPQLTWPHAPAENQLGAREVHVWAASLQPSPELAAAFALTLASDEQARAKRFIFERDRRRFIAARGTLRAILGRCLNCEPAQLNFNYTERGKPSLAGLPENAPLHFNLAHSEELALIAVTKVCPVGIDVEQLRQLKDFDGIAERFFSPRETALLKSLSREQKQEAFFNLWTRKESWLKATGDGIGELLARVEVSLLPEEPARLLSLFDDAQAAAKWTLHDLNPAIGYKGALALPCPDSAVASSLRLDQSAHSADITLRVQCWSWRGEDMAALVNK